MSKTERKNKIDFSRSTKYGGASVERVCIEHHLANEIFGIFSLIDKERSRIEGEKKEKKRRNPWRTPHVYLSTVV